MAHPAPLRLAASLAGAAVLAAALAATVSAARTDAAAYRSRVNAICRSYTPKLRRIETEMTALRAAGDLHEYAYDIGLLISLGLREDARIERTPVPPDAAARMARPLQQLRAADVVLRRIVARALAGDGPGIVAESRRLAKLQGPLSRSLDAAGLRDCGSNQT